jgi:hypothetical protein
VVAAASSSAVPAATATAVMAAAVAAASAAPAAAMMPVVATAGLPERVYQAWQAVAVGQTPASHLTSVGNRRVPTNNENDDENAAESQY